MGNKRDYYEVLGVAKTATGEEIKKAYWDKAKKLHPDQNPENSVADRKFQEIAEAYSVLSDQEKRAQYDRHGFAGVSDAGRKYEDPTYNARYFEETDFLQLGNGKSEKKQPIRPGEIPQSTEFEIVGKFPVIAITVRKDKVAITVRSHYEMADIYTLLYDHQITAEQIRGGDLYTQPVDDHFDTGIDWALLLRPPKLIIARSDFPKTLALLEKHAIPNPFNGKYQESLDIERRDAHLFSNEIQQGVTFEIDPKILQDLGVTSPDVPKNNTVSPPLQPIINPELVARVRLSEGMALPPVRAQIDSDGAKTPRKR